MTPGCPSRELSLWAVFFLVPDARGLGLEQGNPQKWAMTPDVCGTSGVKTVSLGWFFVLQIKKECYMMSLPKLP